MLTLLPANTASLLRSLLLVAVAAGSAACQASTPPLPPRGADLTTTSVSGLSSGGYMAGQFHVAHSETVKGAGIVAAGPYACVESVDNPLIHVAGMKAAQAIQSCMLGLYRAAGVPNAQSLARRAAGYAQTGKIDALENMSDDRVYVFTGAEDKTVVTPIVEVGADFYRAVGVPDESILFVKDEIDAAHAFITQDQGADCGEEGPHYISDCDYDQAGKILSHIYGPLIDPSPEPGGEYLVFDQLDFTDRSTSHGLDDEGVVYIPESCQRGEGCRLHVVFHGCRQGREKSGDAFVKQTGYARWADTNRIILLFPQIAAGAGNPQGCWDWWGYTGPDYYAKAAPQIDAVYGMVERLSVPP